MRFTKNMKGMAMIEILVAMFIFALVLFPLVKLQVLSMSATRAGIYKTETAAAAESMMDYLKSDLGAIFGGKWEKVVVMSGENCDSKTTPQDKVACQILNNNSAASHPDGNAILCILGRRPTYGSTGKSHDQYLISIRAIWYSDKRQELGKSDDPKKRPDPYTYNEDLKNSDCGEFTNDKQEGLPENIIDKDNIDSIQIDMAY